MAVRCTKQRDVSARLRQRSSKGVRVVDSRRLASWGAFLSPHVETVELDGRHTKSATFAMWGSGFSCELTYLYEHPACQAPHTPFSFLSFCPPVSLVRPRRRLSLAPTAYCRRPARAGCVKAGRFSAATRQGSAFTRPSTTAGLDGSGRLHSLSYGVVLLYSDHVCFFGRSCYEVHGACDSRINLYPAAPIRLAKVLLAWTIAQVDGAHLLNGILASANLRCGSTATHPTCPTHGCRNSARYRVRVAPCGTRPCSR